MQQHVHSGQIKGRWVLLLSEDAVCLTTTGSAKQQRTRATSGVIDILQTGLARCYYLCQYLANLLRSVELASLLTCSSSKLTYHVFVGITEDVNVTGIFQSEVNAIKCHQHITDESVLIVCRLTEFGRSKVYVRKESTKVVFAFLSDGAVLNLFQ